MKCLGVEANFFGFECNRKKKDGWVENKYFDITLGFAFCVSSLSES